MGTRHVVITEDELRLIRQLYEGVMSEASHGLLFKEGSIIGVGMAEVASKDGEYFAACARILTDRSWVRKVEFGKDTITVEGSVEVDRAERPTCHRLRGILRKLFEKRLAKKVYCREVECASTGKPRCIFRIEPMES